MVNIDKEKTILSVKCTKNDYKNLLSKKSVDRIFGTQTEERHSISIIIHPEQFLITAKRKTKTPGIGNFGVYNEDIREFLLRIELHEIIANKHIITGEFLNPDAVPYYKSFEINLIT